MPCYSCIVAGKGLEHGRTAIKTSIRPGVMATYELDRPIMGFDLPMAAMTRIPGTATLSYSELRAELCSTSSPWWLARIYRSRDKELHAYVRFSDDDAAVHHYVLDMPPNPRRRRRNIYPWPSLWYLSTGKRWQARYTDQRWDAYWARAVHRY